MQEREKVFGNQVCRIKNKFGYPDEEASDGYRDLKLCLVFEGH